MLNIEFSLINEGPRKTRLNQPFKFNAGKNIVFWSNSMRHMAHTAVDSKLLVFVKISGMNKIHSTINLL